MIYGSICSGIEAATVAWHPLGWKSAFFSEIEPFACSLLRHRYPEVKNYGDFTKIERSEPIDLLVGGTPCQSFSVAGRRAGMDDARGVLAFEFLRLAERLRPRWILFENVPGLMSSQGGRDLGAWFWALGQCGYSCAYRILDAQYFGVAQRRARLFVVGHLGGDWRPPAAVLFDAPGLRWNPPPSREAGKKIAPTLEGRAGRSGGNNFATSRELVPALTGSGRGVERTGESRGQDPVVVCPTLRAGKNETGGDRPPDTDVDTCESLISMCQNSHSGRIDGESETFVTTPLTHNPYGDHIGREGLLLLSHSLRGDGFDASEDGTGRGTPLIPYTIHGTDKTQKIASETNIAGCVKARAPGAQENCSMTVVAFTERTRKDGRNLECQEEIAYALCNPGSGGRTHSRQIATGMSVRRLTPKECERLQGFPDNYTLVPYRGKLAADGPRYRAIGNSMAVPVMNWIGRRIQILEEGI